MKDDFLKDIWQWQDSHFKSKQSKVQISYSLDGVNSTDIFVFVFV